MFSIGNSLKTTYGSLFFLNGQIQIILVIKLLWSYIFNTSGILQNTDFKMVYVLKTQHIISQGYHCSFRYLPPVWKFNPKTMFKVRDNVICWQKGKKDRKFRQAPDSCSF